MPTFKCLSCGKTLSVTDDLVGRKVRCPACQHVATVPSAVVARLDDDDEGYVSEPPPRPRAVRDDLPERSRWRRDAYDEDDDDRPRRRRIRRRDDEWAECPNCGACDATKLSYTWWGGFIGPRFINTVRCNECRTAYNGIHGDYNTTRILLYNVVILLVFVLPLAICGGVFAGLR
jgi:DNA-directed RNA polymerase subunit RPC12/RpoP